MNYIFKKNLEKNHLRIQHIFNFDGKTLDYSLFLILIFDVGRIVDELANVVYGEQDCSGQDIGCF